MGHPRGKCVLWYLWRTRGTSKFNVQQSTPFSTWPLMRTSTKSRQKGLPQEISAHGRKSNAFNKPRHSGPAAMTAEQPRRVKPSESDVLVAMISPGTRGQGGTQGLGAPPPQGPALPARPFVPQHAAAPLPPGHACAIPLRAGRRPNPRASRLPSSLHLSGPTLFEFYSRTPSDPPRQAHPLHRAPRRRDTPPSEPQHGARLPPRRRNPAPLRRGSGQRLRAAQRARAFPSTHARRVPSRKIW